MADDENKNPPGDDQGGMKIDVTPGGGGGKISESDLPFTEDMSVEPKGGIPHAANLQRIGMAVVIVAVLVGIILYSGAGRHGVPTTTTLTTTTAPVVQVSYLSSCGKITQPGTYYVQNGINTPVQNDACLNITTNNVAIVCNGKIIQGSGPFTALPPFSYGIKAIGVSNLTLTGCGITSFSFGVYAKRVSNLKVTSSNLTTNYVSDLYLNSTSGGTIQNNYIGNSNGQLGAVLIANGSTNNQFINNTLKYNTLVGFNVNSSQNRFTNNYVVGSASGFICTPKNGFSRSNFAQGNTCYNDTGCDFVSCMGTTVPVNLSKLVLQTIITSCGVINTKGSYTLAANLNMQNYTSANGLLLARYGIPCISITASNVTLNCNNNQIYGAPYAAVVARSVVNITINNCKISNSGIGLLLNTVNYSKVSGLTLTNNNASIEVLGSAGVTLSGVTEKNGNYYGAYFSSAPSTIMKNFTLLNNTKYGMYLTNTLGGVFTGGVISNDGKFDVYATSESAGLSADIMSGTSCNVTNTQWATCTYRSASSNSPYFPLAACTDIIRSGYYNLSQNILNAPSKCMKIDSNNVVLVCNGLSITANPFTTGPAILISGRNNVTVSGCGALNYDQVVEEDNSSGVTLTGLTGSLIALTGIMVNHDSNGKVLNTVIRTAQNATIELLNSTNITVTGNNASNGRAQNYGILLLNSRFNTVTNNFGTKNYVGLALAGKSTNNTVYMNNFGISTTYDYKCDAQDSPITAGIGGVNTGTIKSGCNWIAVVPATAGPISCTVALSPDLVSFTNDQVYTSGTTCYSIFANGSAIDCRGHTIIATNGGTFVKFGLGEQQSTIKNCFLKGFSTPIVVNTANQTTILNNTILINTSSSLTSGNLSVINIQNAGGTVIKNNWIYTPYKGITESSAQSGKIQGNNITALGTGITLNKANFNNFANNTVNGGTNIGILLNGSTTNIFGPATEVFNGGVAGMACAGTSKGATNNTDQGGIRCSSNSGCAWISLSKTTCH